MAPTQKPRHMAHLKRSSIFGCMEQIGFLMKLRIVAYFNIQVKPIHDNKMSQLIIAPSEHYE